MIRRGRVNSVLLVIALTAASGAASIAADEILPRDELSRRLQSGLGLFDGAVASLRDDPDRARQQWQDSLGEFLAVRNAGVRSAALEFNIGNTYARLGDIGRAVLHYRRAERINPRARSLQINLDQTRQQVTPRFTVAGGGVFSWVQRTTQWERVYLAGGTSIIGWIALAMGLRFRRTSGISLGVAMIVIALVSASTVAIELRSAALEPPVVVVIGDQVLRAGRGDGYDAVIKERLGAGVELRMIESRGDWSEVRLPNGIVGWLPDRAIERVE